jgi:PEGA domain
MPREGEVVQLEVAEEVSVGDSIVIVPGTTASATVVRMDSRKKKTGPHQFGLNIDSLNLADGTKALLRGSSEKTQSEDSKSKLLLFTPSSPPYPVLSDQGMILLKDTKVTAYISGDVMLDEKHFPPRKKSPDSAEAMGPVPAETPVPTRPTELNIYSEPFGAEIDLDGSFIGNTPLRVVVQPGQHPISLRTAGPGSANAIAVVQVLKGIGDVHQAASSSILIRRDFRNFISWSLTLSSGLLLRVVTIEVLSGDFSPGLLTPIVASSTRKMS